MFHTPLGDLLVELYDTDKPVTVANFASYVESGRYTDTFVQRWEPGFVIQGGGFFVTNRLSAEPLISRVPVFGTITNEYGVGRTFSNLFGTIAMARAGGQTNSATSQWFFNLDDNTNLDKVDGGFTVFGETVAGANVLERFNHTSLTNGIFILSLDEPLNTIPVLSRTPTFDDLIYTEITLPEPSEVSPKISIEANEEGRRIVRWNRVGDFIYHLESAARLPPAWVTVTNTRATEYLIPDTPPEDSARFYRVGLR